MTSPDSATPPLVVLVGPTAGGKTALAIALAGRLPGSGRCLSADSMQVYRGLDLGTAKPTAAERAAAPHELIDLVEPDQTGFTVDTWLALAEERIAACRAAGAWPIVVGGTNLYVQALLEGFAEELPADPTIRAGLEAEPPERLRARLEAVDPAAAARIHPNDRRRTVRALEVHALAGVPISTLQGQWHRGQVRADARVVGLDWPVEAINRRINARVRAMMASGLLEEVRDLLAADRLGPRAREALGYRQLADHLEGRITLEDAVEEIKIRTRRYAKQQRTWLRRFRARPNACFLAAEGRETDALAEEAAAWLLGGASPETVVEGP